MCEQDANGAPIIQLTKTESNTQYLTQIIVKRGAVVQRNTTRRANKKYTLSMYLLLNNMNDLVA